MPNFGDRKNKLDNAKDKKKVPAAENCEQWLWLRCQEPRQQKCLAKRKGLLSVLSAMRGHYKALCQGVTQPSLYFKV